MVREQKKQKRKPVEISGRPHLRESRYCTVREWMGKIEEQGSNLRTWLNRIYGQDEQLSARKTKNLDSVLRCYGKRFGFDEEVCIVRAPGRLNLMGRHIDHRGGFIDFLTFERETIVVAGIRDDNNIVAINSQPGKFKDFRFNISELLGEFADGDWIEFVDGGRVQNVLKKSAGHWSNYIKASTLRLQNYCVDIEIKGLNLAVYGDVPLAAGLSSSSTLVVATLQAAAALNNVELTDQQFIDLCATGEWFVGTRGGAQDHAAIYLGQRGKITQVGHLPFRVEKVIDAVEGYQVIIANSHIKATKSSAVKDVFNSRITSYNLGLAVLKQRCPEIVDAVEHLRDVNPENLGCSPADIYWKLLKVPEFMAREDFRNVLSDEYHDMMETNFATHSPPKHYNVRGVLLFGIAETIRGKICLDYLKNGQMELFGNLMNISHDGDRVSRPCENGKYELIETGCSDEYLNSLITDLACGEAEKVQKAQLHMQPGSYACSNEQIDRMVDIVCSVPGVVGAQLAGAGFGGCIMIMAKKESTEAIRQALTEHYYQPNGLKPDVIPCVMAEGSGLAEF